MVNYRLDENGDKLQVYCKRMMKISIYYSGDGSNNNEEVEYNVPDCTKQIVFDFEKPFDQKRYQSSSHQ